MKECCERLIVAERDKFMRDYWIRSQEEKVNVDDNVKIIKLSDINVEITLTEIEEKLFKHVTKEQLIRSRQHFHDENVRLSNELFRTNNRINNLSIWIKNEIEISEVLYETKKEGHMKEIYAMQIAVLNHTLMELDNRKNEL